MTSEYLGVEALGGSRRGQPAFLATVHLSLKDSSSTIIGEYASAAEAARAYDMWVGRGGGDWVGVCQAVCLWHAMHEQVCCAVLCMVSEAVC